MIRYNGRPTARGDPVCDFCGRLFAGQEGPLFPFCTPCGLRMHMQCFPSHVRGPPVCQACEDFNANISDMDSLEATPGHNAELGYPSRTLRKESEGRSARPVVARDILSRSFGCCCEVLRRKRKTTFWAKDLFDEKSKV